MITVTSLNDFRQQSEGLNKHYLLIYKKGTAVSDCAYSTIAEAAKMVKDTKVFTADATQVSDIHPALEITSAPSLVVFEKGVKKDVVKGCNDVGFFKTLFESAAYATANGEQKKSVTVYSTPTCSWCNTLKGYLRKNGIPFTDIDVSRNQSAGEEMVRATGQRGVPQTRINGEWVVGFDQAKLNRLLGVNTQ